MPPLLFLMLVSMVKDFLEDKRRRAADEQENSKLAVVVEPDSTGAALNNDKHDQLAEPLMEGDSIFQKVPWKQIKTGQIVRVEKNEFFPSDLILLASSEPKNLAFVETKNLDGETNLKNKNAPKGMREFKDMEELAREFEGEVICECPND